MIAETNQLLENYLSWLKDTTTLRQVEEWVEITTPYLDRHNDYLQIYIRRQNGDYLITDDGYILGDLERSGCKLDTPKRHALLTMTLNGFGVQLANGELTIRASQDNFAQKKHNLIQAMLAINDLFYLAMPTVASVFFEDVIAWLDLHDIRYTPKAKFTGRSGLDHLFDFVIPKSRSQPERILQAVNRPARDTAQTVVFSWIDTKEVRSPDSKAYAILNNTEHAVSGEVLDIFRNYEVTPVSWSTRDMIVEELAA
ncbi:MAG: DUF1829 domain-containing protein [Methanoregula sp.]|nr:DUF1829 domain-containing protein [Methanoregula sp.]